MSVQTSAATAEKSLSVQWRSYSSLAVAFISFAIGFCLGRLALFVLLKLSRLHALFYKMSK
jgi:hypothetical protein